MKNEELKSKIDELNSTILNLRIENDRVQKSSLVVDRCFPSTSQAPLVKEIISANITSTSRKSPICHLCGVKGHIRPKCPRRNARTFVDKNHRQVSKIETRKVVQKTRTHKLPRLISTCHHCGKQGHIRPNCFRLKKASDPSNVGTKRLNDHTENLAKEVTKLTKLARSSRTPYHTSDYRRTPYIYTTQTHNDHICVYPRPKVVIKQPKSIWVRKDDPSLST